VPTAMHSSVLSDLLYPQVYSAFDRSASYADHSTTVVPIATILSMEDAK